MGDSKRRLTMRDVARRAGVSVATVSYVLNGKREVSAATSKRIMKIVEDLGYHPSGIAQSLAKNTTGMIAVLS